MRRSTSVLPLCLAHEIEWWISPNPGGSSQPGYLQVRSRAMIARVWCAVKMRCSRPTLRTVESGRSEEHTSELQSRGHLVCRLLLEKKKTRQRRNGERRRVTTKTNTKSE